MRPALHSQATNVAEKGDRVVPLDSPSPGGLCGRRMEPQHPVGLDKHVRQQFINTGFSGGVRGGGLEADFAGKPQVGRPCAQVGLGCPRGRRSPGPWLGRESVGSHSVGLCGVLISRL